jgi:hypothetical protein
MRTAVYEYGLLQPLTGEDEVSEQISLAHKYYNTLIEIERWRRLEVRAAQEANSVLAPLIAEYEKLDAEVVRLKAQNKQAKSRDGKTKPPPRGAIKEAQAAKRTAGAALHKAKEAEAAALKPLYEAADTEATKRRLVARSECNVYWGTYLQIEQAVAQACRFTKKKKEDNEQDKEQGQQNNEEQSKEKKNNLPKFRRWTGRGLVAVQIQASKPVTAETVFGNDTRVQIAPIDDKAWDTSISRGQRKKLQRTVLRLRVNSTPDGKPVWAEWPMFMHRALPKDAKITWVKVLRQPWHQRWKYRWVVQFTIDVPEPTQWLGDCGRAQGRTVAVNLGWRKLPDGQLRVATWADDAGNTGEVKLPVSFRERLKKAQSIQSSRDTNMDMLKEWLVGGAPKVARWKSPARFYALAKDESLSEGVRKRIDEWVYRDRHLWWYQRGCESGARKFRREIYRLMALDLASRYPQVIIENYDIRQIAEDEKRAKPPSRQRVEGAPSEARAALRAAVSRLGGILIDGESKLATQECHKCGYGREEHERWDASRSIMHTCAGCGATWDQDVNNALVLLTRAMVMIQKGELLAEKKPKRRARFAKRHKSKESATA